MPARPDVQRLKIFGPERHQEIERLVNEFMGREGIYFPVVEVRYVGSLQFFAYVTYVTDVPDPEPEDSHADTA